MMQTYRPQNLLHEHKDADIWLHAANHEAWLSYFDQIDDLQEALHALKGTVPASPRYILRLNARLEELRAQQGLLDEMLAGRASDFDAARNIHLLSADVQTQLRDSEQQGIRDDFHVVMTARFQQVHGYYAAVKEALANGDITPADEVIRPFVEDVLLPHIDGLVKGIDEDIAIAGNQFTKKNGASHDDPRSFQASPQRVLEAIADGHVASLAAQRDKKMGGRGIAESEPRVPPKGH